jgi:hypothetical protein
VIRGACLGAFLLLASSARADDRKPIAVAAAIVPGLAVHGTGHFVARKPAIGRRLLIAEGVGLGMTVSSLAIIAATGASRRIVTPLAMMTVTGVGLFAVSALADIYGVAAREGGYGTPLVTLPWIETSAGVRGVYDPQFSYGAVVDQAIDVRLSRVRVRLEAMQAPAGAFSRTAALLGVRILSTPDHSFIDLEGGLSDRAYRGDGFSATTLEGRLASRLNLEHFASTMRGSFAELMLGTAIVSYRYAAGGVTADDLLLVRVGYGVYLGARSEMSLYYDHRRDTIAGGGLFRGIGAGYAGYFGLDARYFFDRQWGIAIDARAGGAYIAGASLIFRAQ